MKPDSVEKDLKAHSGKDELRNGIPAIYPKGHHERDDLNIDAIADEIPDIYPKSHTEKDDLGG